MGVKETMKYKKMWEGFYKIHKHNPIRQGHYPNGIAKPSTSVGELMKDYEQGYFPKKEILGECKCPYCENKFEEEA